MRGNLQDKTFDPNNRGQRAPFLSPLLLSAPTLAVLDSPTSYTSVQMLNLMNPNKAPMLIDQIRFDFEQLAFLALPPLNIFRALAELTVRIKLGGIPITNNYVTLGSLAPRFNGINADLGNVRPAFSYFGEWVFSWHLIKPLYVPPNVQLSIEISRQEPFVTAEAPFTIPIFPISIVGRSLPIDYPIPDTIEVPWVSDFRVAKNLSSRVVSNDSDLINTHDVPLNVRHFVGYNYTKKFPGVTYPVTPADMTCQMTASNNTMFIRDPQPFFSLFPVQNGVLNVNARIQPGAFFRCELEIQNVPTGAPVNADAIEFTSVAMHGFREVQTPQGAR